MLRAGIQPDHFHQRQAGSLPGQYGLRVTEIAEGRFCGEFELQPWMWAPNGYLHAASVIVLADTCAGYATMAHLPDGAKNFTTVELKSNFLGTAQDGDIRCTARPLHQGRTTQVWDAVVTADGSAKSIAQFRCTQMILWPKA